MTTGIAHHPTQSINLQDIGTMQNIGGNNYETLETSIMDTAGAGGIRDAESFFDDLAYLDGAENLENQPKFMQNLGFAPDANIMDLLTTEYNQLNPLIPPYVPTD